jgi:GDPmannose 4,6-dehydratase
MSLATTMVQRNIHASKRALITGATGQDGWYLKELLLGHGYTVHAQSRATAQSEVEQSNLVWHRTDLTDVRSLERLIYEIEPDEIYNLASISGPQSSWSMPMETASINALVPQSICQILTKLPYRCRFFQASSSEIFGNSGTEIQNEDTPHNPTSPYGVAKDYAHRVVGIYRQRFGIFASCGILFNHESPRRSLSFVSQKIAHAAAAVSLGLTETAELDERGFPLLQDGKVRLGNLKTSRDFGFAGDYVEAMFRILQHDHADDFVVGTGIQYSIEEFCAVAFRFVGKNWKDHVLTDTSLLRPGSSGSTQADISKIEKVINWRPTVKFVDLIEMMVRARIVVLRSADKTDLARSTPS